MTVNAMKKIIKSIAPPVLYAFLKRVFAKPRTFSPTWNTLTYAPLKGVRIFFDPSGPWQKTIIDNTYDAPLFEAVRAARPEGKVIFDIGAHIGFHSLYFARLVGAKGKVYAFEPNPKNLERFQLIRDKNEDIKKIISVFGVAVADRPGTEKFSLSEDVEGGRSSGGFIDSADTIWDRAAFRQRGFFETKVRTVPVDLFKEELGIAEAPDIIKIDVEGAESLVVRGAKNTLMAKRPLLFLEVHSMRNMFEVTSFLSSLSYEMKIIHEESDGRCFMEARPAHT